MSFKRILNRAIQSLALVIDEFLRTTIRAQIQTIYLDNHRNDYTVEGEKIVFVHVPKTGGTTVQHILGNYFPSKSIYDLQGRHLPISFYACAKEVRYITFLRDPIERVFSYYLLQLRDPTQLYHHLARAGLAVLLENCWECRNMFVRYYSGRIRTEPDESTLEEALCNLHNFYFVGNFSNLESDLHRLVDLENLPEIVQVPHLNSHQKSRSSLKQRRLISKYNKLDISLLQQFYADPS